MLFDGMLRSLTFGGSALSTNPLPPFAGPRAGNDEAMVRAAHDFVGNF
jgi:hypothetical protein